MAEADAANPNCPSADNPYLAGRYNIVTGNKIVSFERDGFLDMNAAAIATLKQGQVAWFDLAARLNRMGMRLIREIAATPGRQELVFAFFARSVSNFQGAVLMSERGMTAEAGTLARTCLETVLYMAAAAIDEDFSRKLKDDHEIHQRNVAQWILGLSPDQQGCSPEQLDELRRIADVDKEKSSIKMRKLAEATGRTDLYRSVYAHLSSSAAHPKAAALEQYADLNNAGEWVGMTWGPHTEGIADVIDSTCQVFLHALAIANDALNESKMAGEWSACKERYDELLGQSVKRMSGT
jgi:hypothetical protein